MEEEKFMQHQFEPRANCQSMRELLGIGHIQWLLNSLINGE
jgi:hypothetical protein